ncbi:hypothetical protein H6G94_36065 [Nostoc punctiforme FACHB-252]|uniref:HEPN domain-containing protein n=1 Tax=Nostoc punctiforme FACHB-252 TaxID=1357509 RepID=A0ABR8HMZ1_NOSPU|nr:hypothetical protein [Nostoc punctiforme]MBD2616574.1 hypothetical protein [Nostoc punctiforme FACHB-252]
MSVVAFTDREMQKAWQANLQASMNNSRNNAHRLLLFYAIECGLKAILMKRQGVSCTIHCKEISEAQHNINKLLDFLSAGQALKLPNQFNMSSINDKGLKQERKLDSGKINQMWRYGGKVTDMSDGKGNTVNITDEDLEKCLIKISQWIEKELRY